MDWTVLGTAVTSVLAWVLANGLDLLSITLAIQSGNRFAFGRPRPAEWFVVYAGLRVLLTLAACLMAAYVSKRWSSSSRAVWAVLTALALVTAVAAWWRLYS
jgi:hypothetical protein